MFNKDAKITIGENVYIGQNTVIGSYPFIFNHNEGNIYRTHYGGVEPNMEIIIGDNVWIGDNVIIQCGFEGPTIIGNHVKIDHQVGIGHDSIIHDRVCLTLGCRVGGVVEIDEDTYVGLATNIKPKVYIGKRCLIGMGSNVTKDIPDGVIAYGNPCRPARENQWFPPQSEEYYPSQII